VWPQVDQSDAVVDVLSDAMSAHFAPGHIPNKRGKAIDNAIGASFSPGRYIDSVIKG
jgi:hypothetical protein